MRRRDFMTFCGGAGAALLLPTAARADEGSYRDLLVLIELKGGNDGLNTVVPYANPAYQELRPRIGIRREQVLQLDQNVGLHPELRPLMPIWQNHELAVIQGVGYPAPNLSHFRSIEIWDTASRSDQYLQQGWLTRAFAARPVPTDYSTDGVIIGSQELGPLAGGARAITLADTEQFLRSARLAVPEPVHGNAALAHLLKVESDIIAAAEGLRPRHGPIMLQTAFPQSSFGNVVKTAAHVVAAGDRNGSPVAVLRLTIGSFDTHWNQPGTHANLLRQLAEGLAALRAALVELKRWDSTVVLSYAEFGRRARENMSNGTDHGAASAHFMLGGRVKGGLFGAAPDLARLDGVGNIAHAVDFRSVYATVLEKFWHVDAKSVLGGRFAPLDLLQA